MTKIGITGGIGCGKSYVCNKFREQGYPVYDCDKEAKRLMVEDKFIISQIKQLVGYEAYLPDGTLNVPLLAKYLFQSPENQTRLNLIVHPAVKDDFLRWADRQTSDKVFIESAILFEAGFRDVVDMVGFVSAPLETRIQRIMKRDKTTREHAIEWISKQMPDEEKRKLADFVIENG